MTDYRPNLSKDDLRVIIDSLEVRIRTGFLSEHDYYDEVIAKELLSKLKPKLKWLIFLEQNPD